MSALRVARAATGRPRILKFDGCYHGHADSMLVRAGSGLAGQAVGVERRRLRMPSLPRRSSRRSTMTTSSIGCSTRTGRDRRGDCRAAAGELRAAAATRGVAASPRRSLPRAPAHLLIFDEVISGFRIGMTGMAAASAFGRTSSPTAK